MCAPINFNNIIEEYEYEYDNESFYLIDDEMPPLIDYDEMPDLIDDEMHPLIDYDEMPDLIDDEIPPLVDYDRISEIEPQDDIFSFYDPWIPEEFFENSKTDN